MKNIWRGICIAIFVFGSVLLFQAQKNAATLQAGSQSIDVSDTEPARSFVVNYVDSKVSPAGIVTQTGITSRYVKADGEWRLEHRRNNSQSEATVYGGTPDGVFEKDKTQTRRYVSPSSDQSILQLFRSHNYLRNHPEFIRNDEVAGLKMYVLRTEVTDTANPEQWQERSYAPETGLTILKFRVHMRDGSEMRRDAVSIEFNDVPGDLNHDLKNLPIRPTVKKT